MLLGSAHVKAECKMLVKLTSGLKGLCEVQGIVTTDNSAGIRSVENHCSTPILYRNLLRTLMAA